MITRETVEEVLEAASEEASPAPEQPGRAVRPGSGRSPVIGAVKVPPWRPGLDVSVPPQALAVLAGNSDRAVNEITAEADAASLDASQRTGLPRASGHNQPCD